MSCPHYLDGIINTHYHNKQLQSVKSEIKKLLPMHSFKSAMPTPIQTDLNHQLQLRKTISNCFNVSSSNTNSTSTPTINPMQTFNQFHPKPSNHRISLPFNQATSIRESSNKHQDQNIILLRKEMMRRMRPQLNIQTSYQILQSGRSKPLYPNKMQQKGHRLQMKSSPSFVKSKIQSSRKSTIEHRAVSHKNLILIKPTFINNDESGIKIPSKQKKIFLKGSKQTHQDIYFNPPDSQHWDDLTLQRIANFKALLPFLGTQKAKVETKPDRKQPQYRPEKFETPKHNDFERPIIKKEIQCKEPISGWQILYD